jgi:hypothetical protein
MSGWTGMMYFLTKMLVVRSQLREQLAEGGISSWTQGEKD